MVVEAFNKQWDLEAISFARNRFFIFRGFESSAPNTAGMHSSLKNQALPFAGICDSQLLNVISLDKQLLKRLLGAVFGRQILNALIRRRYAYKNTAFAYCQQVRQVIFCDGWFGLLIVTDNFLLTKIDSQIGEQ